MARSEPIPLNSPSDLELVRRVRDGDRDAFGVLYERHADALYRFALSFSRDRNRDDAMDITAEAFEKCLASLGRFEGRSSFRTWLFGTARISALRFYSHRDRRRQTVRLDAPRRGGEESRALEVPAEGPTPPEAYAAGAEGDLLWELIGKLRNDRREVVICRYIHGLTTEETSLLLGRSKGAVKMLLARALKEMRGQLNWAGVK